jgi:hypothetical protein
MEWADLNCGSYSHEITMNKKLNKLYQYWGIS